ncbi:sugar ABC transporter ATP-binding protein [Acidisoma cellulosilytica]|uniref:Sugar ABC transporter ATP-binding protein n=1 Tax=Acidisoma cellulosilyticum TaxID=2802395 RepID=A0A963Z582_9PROT|nr:ATP-binding cassette domain-containing protein [Acidisoma cellulosilyticum]MCB8882786.1 sugar ABC transporter ATP-binding protein [Acidisoma cellulosilyticum]
MQDIRKDFGSIKILHGINFAVAAGEIHALVGHNGAGKSTLLSIADKVTVLREGRVVQTGPASQIKLDELAHLLVGGAEMALGDRQHRAQRDDKIILQVENLCLAGRPPANLSLHAREIIGIAGLVGAGRTSLARAIVGDMQAEGRVTIYGREIRRRNPARCAEHGILLVPEDRKAGGLALLSSIQANIELSALKPLLSRLGWVRQSRRVQLVEAMIKSFRIYPPNRKKAVGHLSGGNAQKVLLARAIAAKPRVLILDQPTAGVDIGAKAEIHKLIGLAADGGVATLVSRSALDRTSLLAAISRRSASAAEVAAV